MIIGLTGTFAAGKDAIADYIAKKGFEHFSTGEEVAEIAKEKGIKNTRDNLRELANDLRDEYGPEFLSRRVIEKKAKSNKIIITGLRQPGEIEYLKSLGDFYLIAVDAPTKVRFLRMQERKRPGDPETLEQMVAKEEKEMESKGLNAQKIHECMAMADYLIINEKGFNELYKEVDRVVDDINKKKSS